MLKTLDKIFLNFYRFIPKLPKTFRKNLADYYYLLVLGWLIYQVVGLLRMLAAMGLVTFFDIVDLNYTVDDSLAFFIGVSLMLQLVQVFLGVFAISLVRTKKKKGWDLMFVSFLVAIFSLFYHWFNTEDLAGALFTAIVVWLFGYLLYEVKALFNKKG